MKSLKISILSLFLLLGVNSIFAQKQQKLSLNEGTIDNQFEFVIRRSSNYKDYKVVKANWLYALKAHTLDSLKAIQNELNNVKTVVNSQQKEIDALKTNLESTNTILKNTRQEKNNIPFFGYQISKFKYNLLMWFIIIALLVLSIFLASKFKSSNTITKAAKQLLEDVEEKFEEHRRIALEREQKVRRQLLDEKNKNRQF